MYRRTILIFLGFLFLAACSGIQSPRLIAALPMGGQEQSYPVPASQIIYDAYLEIEVFDPVDAAAKAGDLAETFGGYLISSQTYRWEKESQVTVVLAVPGSSFEKLRAALVRLGRLKHERLSGDWQESDWRVYSEVTVNFQPSAVSLPDLPGGWNPGLTLRRAFSVFLQIFGFLADILIWVVVVVGPFFLIGWGAFRLFRRLRRPS